MTNTPSPTDEDRELIVGLKRATRHCDNAGAIAAIEQAADRLESLLSDRAKLEEALDYLRSARSNIVAAKGLSALTYLDDAVESLCAALNRSTDRAA